MRFGLASIALLLITGCSTLANSAIREDTEVDPKKDVVFTLDATLRNAYLIKSGAAGTTPPISNKDKNSDKDTNLPNGWYLCSEPQPDAATQLAAKASLSGEGGRIGADASAEAVLEYNTAVIQLAGRTSSVLIARDFMFNICILRANGFISNEEAFSLASETIGLIRDIAQTDKIEAATQAARADVPLAAMSPVIDYTNERDLKITAIAVGLLQLRDADQRKSVITEAFACAEDQKTCQAQRDQLIAAQELEAVVALIGRQPAARINRLHTALASKEN
jgi:hypothetical protein